MSARRWFWRGLAGLLTLVAVAAVGFVVWASSPRDVMTADLTAVQENPAVEVVKGRGYVAVLPPGDGDPARGVVFYPGARVAPDAYVPTWAPIVERTGAAVIIPSMPLNFAVFDVDRAAGLIGAYPGIGEWWVGGHSLGGAIAAEYAGRTPPGELEGLILWGAYASNGAALRGRDDLSVLSVSGGRDGLSTRQEVSASRATLPSDAVLIEIEGMSHAQFGRYGAQRGDLEPTISGDEAEARLTDAVAEFWASP